MITAATNIIQHYSTNLFSNVDREAYYAIVSLLIDNSRIPSDVRELSGANCEEFVPAEDLIILDVLKK